MFYTAAEKLCISTSKLVVVLEGDSTVIEDGDDDVLLELAKEHLMLLEIGQSWTQEAIILEVGKACTSAAPNSHQTGLVADNSEQNVPLPISITVETESSPVKTGILNI